MNISLRQVKFNGGELGPLLYGDTSHPRYGSSLRLCKNWIPLPQGALANRPGTTFKGFTPGGGRCRQVAFVFSDERAYVLLFTDLLVSVYHLGVLQTSFATPWTAAQLPRLKWAQVGNVITFTIQGVAPQDIAYNPATMGWSITSTPLRFLYDANTPPAGFPPFPVPSIPAYDALHPYDIGDRVGAGGARWVSIQTANTGNAPGPGSLFWTEAEDPTHIGLSYQWAQTWVLRRDSDGVAFETNAKIAPPWSGALGLDRPVPVGLAGFAPPAGYTTLYSRLYRGNNGVFGWIANLLDLTVDYIDRGQAPDFTQQPPDQAADPFVVGVTEHYPAVVGHFDNRRYFMNSDVFPQHFWASKLGDFLRWDRPVPGSDEDSVFFALVSNVLEDIRSFAPRRAALLLTGSGEWALRGALSRTNVQVVQQSAWGSSWLDPLKVGIGLLFNTAKGNSVRSLFPVSQFTGEVWDGDEISWQARHFLDGHTIVAWAYQEVPYNIAWIVRDDGVLLSLTFDVKREIIAWAQHDLGGAVEDVCVVPEPPEDAVYLIVNRGAWRCWERLNTLVPPVDQRYAVYLDSAVTFDGHMTGVTLTVTGPNADGAYTIESSLPQFLNGDQGGDAIVFDPDGAKVTAKIVGFIDPTHVLVEAFDQTVSTVTWAFARHSFGITPGLSVLGQDSYDVAGARGISVLADGGTVPDATWNGVVLTLPEPAVVVTVGLGYNSDFTLLDASHPQSEIRNRNKRLLRLGFQVVSSRGLWVGPNFDNLQEWQQRTEEDVPVVAPSTGYYEEEVSDEYGKDGRASVRQWEPLPVTVVSILREMDVSGT